MNRRPILVIGPPRSGTTWVASMIARPDGLSMVHEPDNWFTDAFASTAMAGLGEFPTSPIERDSHWRLWDRAFSNDPVSEVVRFRGRAANKAYGKLSRDARWKLQRNEHSLATRAAVAPIHAVATPLRRPAETGRPVVKTVYSLWNTEQLAERFDAHVVVVRRSLLEGAASWHELGFGSYAFGDIPDFRRQVLEPAGVPTGPVGGSAAAASAWTYAVLDLLTKNLISQNPHWLPVSHQELIADPNRGFRQLYDQLTIEVDEASLAGWIADGDRSGGTWDVQRPLASVGNRANTRLSELDLAEMKRELAVFKTATA